MNAINGDLAIAKSIREGSTFQETPPLSSVIRKLKGTHQAKCAAASKVVREAFEKAVGH